MNTKEITEWILSITCGTFLGLYTPPYPSNLHASEISFAQEKVKKNLGEPGVTAFNKVMRMYNREIRTELAGGLEYASETKKPHYFASVVRNLQQPEVKEALDLYQGRRGVGMIARALQWSARDGSRTAINVASILKQTMEQGTMNYPWDLEREMFLALGVTSYNTQSLSATSSVRDCLQKCYRFNSCRTMTLESVANGVDHVLSDIAYWTKNAQAVQKAAECLTAQVGKRGLESTLAALGKVRDSSTAVIRIANQCLKESR